MQTVDLPRAVLKRPLVIVLVLALVASVAIPAFAVGKEVHHLTGDFNGDGVTTPGRFVDGLFTLSGADDRNRTVSFRYGRPNDVPVVGDWNGDDVDTVGVVRRGRNWFLRDSNTAGVADWTFTYGSWLGLDKPVVGDWTGKGYDRPGVVRGSSWHLRNSLTGGDADISFKYGRIGRGDHPVVGDWNGNGVDTAGVVREGQWFLKNRHAGGDADWTFWYGRVDDVPVVGSWDGRNRDTPGVVRGPVWLLKNTLKGGTADIRLELAGTNNSDEVTSLGRTTDKSSPIKPAKPVQNRTGDDEASVQPDSESEPEHTAVESAEPTQSEPVVEQVLEAAPESPEESLAGESEDAGSDPGSAFAALLSEDELAVQRDRAANGPFRVAGDFSVNSPGHWAEMRATMSLDFTSARWSGPTDLGTDGRVLKLGETSSQTSNDPPANVRQMAHDMMSAAYAAAITGNHTVAAAITEEIEYQATRPNLDYSDRTLWPFDYYYDLNPLFMHAVWVKDYVLAYDITKAMGHASPTVERWFLDLAELNEQAIGASLGRVFPDRKSGNYANRVSSVNEVLSDTRAADGTAIEYLRGMKVFNNRRNNQAGLFGLVGVVLDNRYYKEEFKRYGREWLMFGHRATSTDGYQGDVNRGSDRFPQLGFSYSLHGLESLVPAMDGLARQGDTELYEFSSSEGYSSGSIGTDHFKTMEDVFDTYIKWITGAYPAQYTASGSPPPTAVSGDEYYRIKSRTSYGNEIVNDASLLLPANYYNRTDWHDAIMRIGTPTGFTPTPHNGGSFGGWRMDWRHRFLRSLDTNPYPSRN